MAAVSLGIAENKSLCHKTNVFIPNKTDISTGNLYIFSQIIFIQRHRGEQEPARAAAPQQPAQERAGLRRAAHGGREAPAPGAPGHRREHPPARAHGRAALRPAVVAVSRRRARARGARQEQADERARRGAERVLHGEPDAPDRAGQGRAGRREGQPRAQGHLRGDGDLPRPARRGTEGVAGDVAGAPGARPRREEEAGGEERERYYYYYSFYYYYYYYY